MVPESSLLAHFLLALIVIVVTARALGRLARYLGQPAIIGEVLAGILLGPSLLGRIAPGASAYLLPAAVAPYLQIVAQIGVILFMFLVGLELDTSLLKKRTGATIAISHASIVAPLLLGVGAAHFVYPRFGAPTVPFPVFALFLGVSMAVTAFPVLARILSDRGLQKTELGVIAISCAAVDDVTAWCLLAFVVSFATSSHLESAFYTLGLVALYVTVMLVVARPLMARLVRRQALLGRVTRGATALVFVGLLASALATELAGVHALFGAFLLGAIIPHHSLLATGLREKLEDVVVILLLPAYFAYTGLRTEIGLVSGLSNLVWCVALLVVACAGKFGGGALAARLSGLAWRDAASIGVLMNTRGLMELVVLNIGLDLGVISGTVFAMLVIMALVTTAATTPLVTWLNRGRSFAGAAGDRVTG